VVFADRFIPDQERARAREQGDEPNAIPFLKRFTVFNVAQHESATASLRPRGRCWLGAVAGPGRRTGVRGRGHVAAACIVRARIAKPVPLIASAVPARTSGGMGCGVEAGLTGPAAMLA
jgi:hypothetical protein